MIGLLQRVDFARVEIEGGVVGAIDRGLMTLIGVERGDSEREAERLIERLIGYRVFSDDKGKMNLSLADTGGGLLLVPQFTLPADTRSGARPGLSPAAPPEIGRRLFEHALDFARSHHKVVESGRFATRMRVVLANDGPITFTLRVNPAGGDAKG
ncbi:D-aminoacyl-tRNA deacylase [Thioalkalivibrio sp. HK1]|uniref:D-aminoacyl-tRNA deacylase n=1 Tax=Thioalkalivibrio sp. HK1 TaxID=1469245 RepID=UPI000472D8BA|nr:D-aminoacyl-tRNA deacylase [Thioalkalivibrio sp. HK1]